MVTSRSKFRPHNLKVVDSNPTPATKEFKRKDNNLRATPSSFLCTCTKIELRALDDGFILDKRVEGLSPRTIDFYKAKLRNFVWYCKKQELNSVSLLNAREIRRFLAYLMDNKHRWDSDNPRANRPPSPRSIQHYYGCLRVFFNWLVVEGYTEVNPVLLIKPPKSPKKLINALSSEEIEKLLAEFNGKDFNNIRDKAIIMLFVDTGLRLSELANINMENIDLDRQTILVLAKGNKQRMVRFGIKTAKALWKYLALKQQFNSNIQRLWMDRYGNEVSSNGIALIFKRLANKVGFRVNCHKLRHTYAISALRNGMNPFDIL